MCPVNEILKLVNEYESDGKDVFSRDGLTQLKLIIADITGGKGQSGDIELLRDLCAVMAGMPAADAVLSSLNEQGEEWDKHCRRKRCTVGVCYEVVAAPAANAGTRRRRRGAAE